MITIILSAVAGVAVGYVLRSVIVTREINKLSQAFDERVFRVHASYRNSIAALKAESADAKAKLVNLESRV